jgi:hypothetical protein
VHAGIVAFPGCGGRKSQIRPNNHCLQKSHSLLVFFSLVSESPDSVKFLLDHWNTQKLALSSPPFQQVPSRRGRITSQKIPRIVGIVAYAPCLFHHCPTDSQSPVVGSGRFAINLPSRIGKVHQDLNNPHGHDQLIGSSQSARVPHEWLASVLTSPETTLPGPYTMNPRYFVM